MQDFTRNSGRLRRLPLGARLVYSIFLIFTLAGLALSGWLGSDMLGSDLGRLRVYYAGGAEPAPVVATAPAAGPALDLPADADAFVAEPMPLRKLLEVSHFHLFSMPVYLMVLSHLFMLGRWRERTKLLWIGAASLAVLLHLLAPWLVRGHTPFAAAIYATSGALLCISFLVMSFAPLCEMWLGPRPQ